jgi:hypothetical protein
VLRRARSFTVVGAAAVTGCAVVAGGFSARSADRRRFPVLAQGGLDLEIGLGQRLLLSRSRAGRAAALRANRIGA